MTDRRSLWISWSLRMSWKVKQILNYFIGLFLMPEKGKSLVRRSFHSVWLWIFYFSCHTQFIGRNLGTIKLWKQHSYFLRHFEESGQLVKILYHLLLIFHLLTWKYGDLHRCMDRKEEPHTHIARASLDTQVASLFFNRVDSCSWDFKQSAS